MTFTRNGDEGVLKLLTCFEMLLLLGWNYNTNKNNM